MKKKVVILTLNDYVIYQPTILNLYDHLSSHFDVTIISFKPKFITRKKDEIRNIIYLRTNFLISQFFQKTDFALSKVFRLIKKIFPKIEYYHLYYNKYLPFVLKSAIKQRKITGDIIIATDFPALKIAQEIYGSVHFLSLEIENKTSPVHRKIDRSKVKSVFIQTKERYEYLFPEIRLPVFYVQNAPVFKQEYITHYERKDFIWAGAMDKRLAVFDCINFFDQYPEYRLVLKGGGERKTLKKIRRDYAHLINANRIKIDQDYLPASLFLDFISHFKIGFCFYSWQVINSSFNYATAPSGKLFMTLAAGVPVIACNIPGFKFVEEFGAGILIDDYKPETILLATQKIESDYEKYTQACYEAAHYFSFDKNVEGYIDYLLKDTLNY